MGNSLRNSTDTQNSSHSRRSRTVGRRISVGKNKPLRPMSIRWCSQFPLTPSQLQRKRDEFWETAPAFDGRVEIWNALKVAAEFLERNDVEMAQAIVDGADIILPTGTLCDCYDQLGARYQLPLYVLCEPSNLLSDESSTDNQTSSSPPDNSDVIRSHDGVAASESTNPARNRPIFTPGSTSQPEYNNIRCWPFLACCQIRRTVRTPHGSGRPLSLFWSTVSGRSPNKGEGDDSSSPPPVKSTSLSLNVRLSTGQDHQLELCNDRITVLEAKRLLAVQTNWPESRQRWFACGHLLPNRARICDCRIPPNFIVQCIVHSPFEPESQWSRTLTETKDHLSHPDSAPPDENPMGSGANMESEPVPFVETSMDPISTSQDCNYT